MKLIDIISNLESRANRRDDVWYSWLQQKGLNSLVDYPYAPFKNPILGLLVLGVVFIILAPAIVLMIIGSMSKSSSNAAYTAMAVYAGIIFALFIIVLFYAIVRAIRTSRRKQQLIKQYQAEHPEQADETFNEHQ